MFDVNTTITIGPLRTAAGKLDITVRWPTDEEWAGHHKRRKMFQRQLGRGQTEYEIERGEADAKLYEAIKLNGAPPLTTGEAQFIIETISQAEILGVELRADDAEVLLNTSMGEATHVLRIPTFDEVRTLRRSNRVIAQLYNRQEIRTSLEASAALWDKCSVSSAGYSGPVPNIHKDAAIRAVIAAIEQEAAPKNDESNF